MGIFPWFLCTKIGCALAREHEQPAMLPVPPSQTRPLASKLLVLPDAIVPSTLSEHGEGKQRPIVL